jgi:hypothetical protein
MLCGERLALGEPKECAKHRVALIGGDDARGKPGGCYVN